MRRTHLRHHENIAKRLLVHIAAFNLGLLMRKRFGVGKPRCLQGLSAAPGFALIALFDTLVALMRPPQAFGQWNFAAPSPEPAFEGVLAAP